MSEEDGHILDTMEEAEGTDSLGSTQTATYEFESTFQMKILALLVSSPETPEIYREVIRPEYFDEKTLRYLCETVYKFVDGPGEGSAPSKDELLEFVDDRGTRNIDPEVIDRVVHEIYGSDYENLNYVEEKVEDFAKRQNLINATKKIVTHIENGEYDKCRTEIEQATIDIGRNDYTSIDFFSEFPDYLHEKLFEEQAKRKIPTGIPILDRKLQGGHIVGKCGVVQGPTSVGKTMKLLNIGAGSFAKGNDVAFFTIEDDVLDTGRKLASRVSGIPIDELPESMDRIRKVFETYEEKVDANLIIEKIPYRNTTEDIRSRLSKLWARRNFDPDVVIIDYMDDMESTKHHDNEYDEQGELIIDFKAMGERHEAAVWTATQTNRDSIEKAKISMAQTSDSIKKLQKADLVLSLCQTEKEFRDGILRIYCNKSSFSEKWWEIETNVNTDVQRIEGVEE